jgi:hypothetical protein
MNPETKKALHRELTRLRHDVTLGIQSKGNGICYNTIYNSFGNCTIEIASAAWDLGDLCHKWPKAVDFDRYPVPCPGYANPAEGYHATEDKWAGEYGLLRMELLDWLIQETAP